MQYQIIGIEKTSFTPKDGNRTFNGVRLHCVYDKPDMEGQAVEAFYCNSSVDVEGLNIGDICEILYNRYGKVAQVRKVG